jgi:putative membrane protein
MSRWDRSHDQYELARERTAEAKRRTHLANERTYAAWTRTALTLVGVGVAIAGYFHMVGSGRAEVFVALGLAFVVGGGLMAILATYAYRRTYRDIEKGNFDHPAGLPLLLGVIPIILGLLALLLIVIR